MMVLGLFACKSSEKAYDLQCEGLTEPLGIDSPVPHFSWKANINQSAWCIQLSDASGKLIWDSGKVEGTDRVMVKYGGEPLESREIYVWKVKMWDNEGQESAWSEPQRFSVGIIGSDSLKGDYIGAVPGEGRSAILRKHFSAKKTKNALLYVNSLGYHEVYVNGQKVGDAVLTPAVSQLNVRSLINTYDISSYLIKGENDIALWTGSGWYKPVTFQAVYEGALVKAELDIDGKCVLNTDASWEGAFSGYRDLQSWFSGQFGGEEIDAALVPQSMTRAELDKLEWNPVDVVAIEGISATQQMCEPCTVQETAEAVAIYKDSEGHWVADMGKVYNAMAEIALPQLEAGQRIPVLFSDKKDPYEVYSQGVLVSSGKEGGDTFANKFNHHVFRYVIFENLDKAPVTVKAHRMRTNYSVASTFECSDPELQSIYDMIERTMENLSFDGYMVDCANIERLGYGGDGNASTLSLQSLANVAPLYMNWLQAWNDVIHEDGGLPHTAPSPIRAGGGPYWCTFIVQAPWRTYMSYGDPRLLERCYDTMRHWFDYVDAYSYDGLLHQWPDTDYRSWYLGDWLAPAGVDYRSEETVDLVNNCSLSQAYADLVQIAGLLGKEKDKAEWEGRLAEMNKSIHEHFYHPETATYGTGSQIDMTYPLLVGAVPEELIEDVKASLFKRTSEVYEGHIKAGLVGIPIITEWATISKSVDFMYSMLKQRDYPGYLYMIENDATATWESWDGERSRMHNCYNGILSWFFQGLGGITPVDPGFKKVRIEPQVPAGLEWVKVRKDTPYGVIEVNWKVVDGKPVIETKVPAGIEVVQ